MAAQLIDGVAIAGQIRADLKEQVATYQKSTGKTPGLAVILVGDDPASQVYVRTKERACAEVGIRSERHDLPAGMTSDRILRLVERLAKDESIHGILVQLPLPKGIDPAPILHAVPPSKDVDGFHPYNLGLLTESGSGMIPCTAAGVLELIKSTGVNIEGKHAVVIGRSTIVGKPTSLLLLHENATVTMCHSRTVDLPEQVRRADIVVAAVGLPKFVKGDWIKPGAVVIDVGINRTEDRKLCGDVDFDAAKEVAGYITPVPGGVGPMTVALLLRNTLNAALAMDR